MKRLLYIASIIAILLAFACPIYAEGGTYYPVNATGDYTLATITETSTEKVEISNLTSEIRFVAYIDNNGFLSITGISLNSFTYRYHGFSSGSTNTSGSKTYQGNRYYYASVLVPSTTFNSVVPIVTYDSSFGNAQNFSYYYTFGAGAVAPEEPSMYGNLAEVGYYTNIAGSGNAAVNNIDVVKWNPFVDDLGNDITAGTVNIRAVPGSYTSESKQSLLEKAYTDFILDNTSLVLLDTVPVSDGQVSFKWSQVISRLNIPFMSIASCIHTDESWIKQGWIYQVQLVIDDYESEWKTLYTTSSAAPADSLAIINSTNIDNTVIDAIIDINTINDIDIDWIWGEVIIVIPPAPTPTPDVSPTPTPTVSPEIDPDTKLWYTYILEYFADLIRAIKKAVSDLVHGLSDLFTFDSFNIDNYDTEKQELIDNSGMLGESVEFTQSLKDTFLNIQYAEPELHFDGIVLNGQQFIAPLDVNLNDYVTDLGLGSYRQMAYLVVDGVCYFSCIMLVVRKVMEALKK